MFIDGLHAEEQRFRDDAQKISTYVLAPIVKYQRERPPEVQDGKITTHAIMAGVAFAVGVVIHKLPLRDRKRLREYLIHKLDDMLKEHGA